MPLTTEQNLFLAQVLDLGDRKEAKNRQRVEEKTFIKWMQNIDFKTELERYEQYFIDDLIVRIGQAGLKKLDHVLRHGVRSVTITKSRIDHPEFGAIESVKKVEKRESVSLPAVKMAIQLYIHAAVQRDVMNNVAELASRGLLPSDSEALIASHMSDYQERVKDALKGDFERAGIDETVLAQIQQMVIGNG